MRGPAVEIDRIVREVLAELPAGSRDIAACRPAAHGNGTVGPPRASAAQLPPSARNNRPTRGVVITLSDVDGQLDGQGEFVVPKAAIITPLARDYLKQRGVVIKFANAEEQATHAASDAAAVSTESWGYTFLDCAGLAEGAVQAVARQGTPLTPVTADGHLGALCASAEGVASGKLCGAILFCDDAALVACAANKRPGIRAVVADSPAQVARARETLVANVLVIEPSGKTLHELRNILRVFCTAPVLRQPAPEIVELLGDR